MGSKTHLPFFNIRKAKESQSKGLEMRSKVSEIEKTTHEFYFNRIIQLISGSHQMGSHVINLEKIKGWCHYYGIDDTIVYWSTEMKDALIKEGIASYNDSTGGLVITTADYRVKQMSK